MNDHTPRVDLGVIGGSGLYEIVGLTDSQALDLETPFGRPSAPVIVGRLAERTVAFLARHGIGHIYSPSEVNYRANIFALRKLGCRQVISVSACGSLREDFAPGHIVIPDQLFDFTRGGRERTFFSEGLVGHVSTADPFCPRLSGGLARAVQTTGATYHQGGTLITIEGPRFSTRAESNIFRAWGCDLIGMTAAPEAFLAREAQMCYATMAHVTDYDVWHVTEAAVTVDMVIRTLNQNTAFAQQAIVNLVQALPDTSQDTCQNALESAIITHPERARPETRARLAPLME